MYKKRGCEEVCAERLKNAATVFFAYVVTDHTPDVQTGVNQQVNKWRNVLPNK